MTSSGTFNFNPSLGEIVLYAFGLCGISRPQIGQEHIVNARIAANLLQSEHSNELPNLWQVDLQSQVLTQGIATYATPPETIAILDAYIETSPGVIGSQTDIYLLPISRTEYASYPDKLSQSKPTVYWFDRLISPSFTVWATPDGGGPYTIKYYRVRQFQDAVVENGVTLDLPSRFFSAYAFGLAEYLAWTYAPDRIEKLAAKAESLWVKAISQDVEDVGLYITPMLNSYYRR